MKHQFNGGWIEVVCGCMFSGKSEELIRRVKRAEIGRQRVRVFKPVIDTRFGMAQVSAHSGAHVNAQAVGHSGEIARCVEPEVDVVAIDEVQFFDPEVVQVAESFASQGKRVICAGLDMDFRGEPFGVMPDLMARAEEVIKLNAICVVCGAPATRTQRLINGVPAAYSDPIILVGASEAYEPRCRACHTVPR